MNKKAIFDVSVAVLMAGIFVVNLALSEDVVMAMNCNDDKVVKAESTFQPDEKYSDNLWDESGAESEAEGEEGTLDEAGSYENLSGELDEAGNADEAGSFDKAENADGVGSFDKAENSDGAESFDKAENADEAENSKNAENLEDSDEVLTECGGDDNLLEEVGENESLENESAEDEFAEDEFLEDESAENESAENESAENGSRKSGESSKSRRKENWRNSLNVKQSLQYDSYSLQYESEEEMIFDKLVTLETSEINCVDDINYTNEKILSVKAAINDEYDKEIQDLLYEEGGIFSIEVWVDGVLRKERIVDANNREYEIKLNINEIDQSVDVEIVMEDMNSYCKNIVTGPIVYDGDAPAIEFTGNKEGENVEFYVDSVDNLSGIRYSKVYINGEESEAESTKSYGDGKITKINGHYVYKTNSICKVRIVVCDNAGNEAVKEKEIVVDNIAPVITGITCKGCNNLVGDPDNFGYFSDSDVIVNVSAKDNPGGSGLDFFLYCLEDGKTRRVRAHDNTISISIPADYRGHLVVNAYDRAGNEGTFETTVAMLLEKDETFRETVKLDTMWPSTIYQDKNGNPLYASSFILPVRIREDFGGIKKVGYSISDKEKKVSEGVYYGRDLSGKNPGTENGVSIIEKNKNLIYELSLNIAMDFDSSDLCLVIDVEGNNGHMARKTMCFSMDQTSPQIDMRLINNGPLQNSNIYGSSVSIQTNVYDENLKEDGLEYRINGNVINPDGVKRIDDNSICISSEYTCDGEYSVEAVYTDLAGHVSVCELPPFIIDQTAPVISVMYMDNENGQFIGHNRKAYLTVTDDNFDPDLITIEAAKGSQKPVIGNDWLREGENSLGYLEFEGDGKYAFTIFTCDKAGNESELYCGNEFIIDTKCPEININGIKEGMSYCGQISPEISVTDINYSSDKLQYQITGGKNGAMDISALRENCENGEVICFSDFPEGPEFDDHYVLEVETADKANNKADTTIHFNVNRFGSFYEFFEESKQLEGEYLQSGSRVFLQESNLDELSDITAHIGCNGETTDVSEGDYFKIRKIKKNDKWIYYYSLSEKLFEKNGVYQVSFSSKDRAGNINNSYKNSDEVLTFVVDTVVPSIEFLNIGNDFSCSDAGYKCMVYVTDNMELEEVKIFIDGKECSYSKEDNTYTFDLQESNDYQNITVMAKDRAGNEHVEAAERILICSNAIVRLYKDSSVFWGSFTLIFGIIGYAISKYILLRAKRRA